MQNSMKKELGILALFLGIVGLAWFVIPAPAPMTDVGVKVLGLFVAAIVGWTLTEEQWVSILAFIIAMFTGVWANIAAAMPSTWGGDNFMFMAMMFFVIAYLQASGFSKFTASWLLTRKALNGHPWRIFGMLLIIGWILAVFAGILAGLWLTWSFIYQICALADYKPHSKQATAMVFGIGMVGALSLSTIPFLHNALIIIPAFEASAGVAVNKLLYMAFSVPENLLCIAGYLLMCKYILRVDLSAMKTISIDFIPQEDLVFTKEVKLSYAFLIALVVMVFAPNILPAGNPIAVALKNIGNSGICLLLFVVWSFIRVDGKQVFNLVTLGRDGVNWNMIFMSLGIFTFIAILSNPATGISAFLGAQLGPIFAGRPAILLVILGAIMTILLTNLMANMVVAVIMFAAVLPIGAQMGVDPMQLGFLFTICSSIAFCLPCSSPAGQFMFLNHDWLTSTDIWKMAFPTILMMSIVAITWGVVFFAIF